MDRARATPTVIAVAAAAAVVVLVLPRGWDALAAGVVAGAVAVLAWRRAAGMASAPRSPRGDGVATAPAAAADATPAAVIEALEAPALLVDDLAIVVAASEAAATLFDSTPAAIRGRSLIRATGDHDLLQLVRDAAGTPREVTLRSGHVVRATARRLDARGVHALLSLEDLTELRAAQRARSDLVGNVSHELRTPITAALALAETLESGVPDPDRRARFLAQLTAEIARLGEIVDRLLRLSRIEFADEPFHLDPVAPAELLATAADRIRPLAGPDQRVVVEAADAPPVLADRERVLEVLANLLDNALRFSPPQGTVTLSAVPEAHEVRFDVRDEGPGILPSDRARIFERFYTGDRSRTAGRGGTGLGLAIARHIVSRHRGRIWAAPSERGADVRFTLPIAREADPVAPADRA